MKWLARVILRRIQKLLVIGMLVSFGFGLSGIWHGCRNSTPTIVELTQNKPGDLPKHVTLKNVALAVTETVTSTEFGEKTVYIPVLARGAAPTEKIFLLLRSSNQELVGLAKTKAAKTADSSALADAIKIMAQVARQTEITGMTENDFNVSNRLKAALKKTIPTLHHEFQIINEGETPSAMRGLGLLGLSAGLFVLIGISSLFGEEKAAAPPVLDPNTPPPLQPKA